jgi:hypothetical protein
MTTYETPPSAADPHRRLARRTGVAYLGIIATGIFAEFAVRGSLVVADDPIATARNIAAAPGLFGLGICADVVMIALDVVVAVGLFRLLQSVDRRLALVATTLRLVQGAVIAVGLLSLVDALRLATQAVGADGAVLAGPAQAALDAVERHALVYDAGLIAFGLCCLVLGRLLWTGELVSRPLAAGMTATGAVYLTGSLAALFAPSLSAAVDPFYLVAIIVEPAFALRLITRGLDARQLSSPTTTPRSAESPEPSRTTTACSPIVWVSGTTPTCAPSTAPTLDGRRTPTRPEHDT